jgi:hypothetical protein
MSTSAIVPDVFPDDPFDSNFIESSNSNDIEAIVESWFSMSDNQSPWTTVFENRVDDEERFQELDDATLLDTPAEGRELQGHAITNQDVTPRKKR